MSYHKSYLPFYNLNIPIFKVVLNYDNDLFSDNLQSLDLES